MTRRVCVRLLYRVFIACICVHGGAFCKQAGAPLKAIYFSSEIAKEIEEAKHEVELIHRVWFSSEFSHQI